jgi:hypothetical protein
MVLSCSCIMAALLTHRVCACLRQSSEFAMLLSPSFVAGVWVGDGRGGGCLGVTDISPGGSWGRCIYM